jgi:hypothetical protein
LNEQVVGTGLGREDELHAAYRHVHKSSVHPAANLPVGEQRKSPHRHLAPVPRVLAVGAKAFAEVAAGFGVSVDGGWLPPVFNDGPGWRLGVSLTYERR